jgi:heme A synthase
MSFSRSAKYAWIVLAYNVLVILWGAFVRATGSGAGCGGHWPLCNGQVIPRAAQIDTVIEFAHRLTSGLSVALIIVLLAWVLRIYPKGHPARLGASLSMLFIVTEALLGAGLVLFSWVAQNASAGRVISSALHLTNTFLLLAALSLTAWWASGGKALLLKRQGQATGFFLAGLCGVLVLGVTGAINALGDTLFPARSLVEGMAQDFSPTANFLLHLRVWHPVVAMLVGFYAFGLAGLVAMYREERPIRRLALGLIGAVGLQFAAGVTNLILLAPVWMQIVHLFLADMVWIALVLLAASNLVRREEAVT